MWDLLLLSKAFAMGIIEGLTEFLPISSTGHLIVAGQAIGFHHANSVAFEIVIQLAAIFAVMFEYKERVVQTVTGLGRNPVANRFALNVVLAFLPLAVLGLIFASQIKAVLFAAVPVAVAFIVGGLIILWVESRVARAGYQPRVLEVDQMSALDAFKIGLIQAFALIPGTSRSGATIIGGLWIGLSRVASTQFSFFLAMPTILAASLYELLDSWESLVLGDLPVFLVGSLASFISAYVCVRWLLRFVARHDFRWFAWYRIFFGLLILVVTQTGWVTWS
ncbi:MAG: undecaprenyl-diphosphate phosphatase [Limnobacter sp.]|nr:undecaprenyl-diphosphate phosphatase [Limnobacter sp.]